MSRGDLLALGAAALADAVRAGRARADDVVAASLAVADELEGGGANAFVARHRDARAALRAADQIGGDVAARRAAARGAGGGVLAGVPVAVADNLADLALPTTCGSRALAGYVSPYEATAVARLYDAGAVIVGKTNVDEFGMGASTEHSAYGPARNPVDPTRVPGGASGGAAAAVVAGVVRIALGVDTGGCVRQPAAFCGVVGIKPTYGRVSRSGLVAHASSLDQVGVFGRSVDDAALALEVVSGRDPRDPTSADYAVGQLRAPTGPVEDGRPLKGMRVGRPKECFPPTLDAGMRERFDAAIASLRDLGAEIKEVSLPHTKDALPTFDVIAAAEAASNLARYDGVRFGRSGDGAFGAEVTRRVLLGTHLLAGAGRDAHYRRAQRLRVLVARDFADVFDEVDLLFAPTTSTVAFAPDAARDAADAYDSMAFTVAANLAGVPALSLPVGRAAGLPLGGQLLAPYFGEAAIFRAAAALERVLGREAHQ